MSCVCVYMCVHVFVCACVHACIMCVGMLPSALPLQVFSCLCDILDTCTSFCGILHTTDLIFASRDREQINLLAKVRAKASVHRTPVLYKGTSVVVVVVVVVRIVDDSQWITHLLRKQGTIYSCRESILLHVFVHGGCMHVNLKIGVTYYRCAFMCIWYDYTFCYPFVLPSSATGLSSSCFSSVSSSLRC